MPEFYLKDFYIGAMVNILSRQMKIIDYGDQYTRSKFEAKNQRTFAMIKPDAVAYAGKIISRIEKEGFSIARIKYKQFTLAEVQNFYGEHKGKVFYENLTNFIKSGPVIGMELIGEDTIAKWRELIGPTNVATAKSSSPNSIRALYGTEGVRNAVHGSDAVESAKREIEIFFGEKDTQPAFLTENISCVVIKPHVIKDKKVGEVLEVLLDKAKNHNLKLAAFEMFNLEKLAAEEFLEVYKGVLAEYGALVEELASGSCIAIALQGDNLTVQAVRKIIGPHDPQIAKSIRSNTLRSVYGKDKVRNGLHCTDLEEDGQIECEFFFSIMQAY